LGLAVSALSAIRFRDPLPRSASSIHFRVATRFGAARRDERQ